MTLQTKLPHALIRSAALLLLLSACGSDPKKVSLSITSPGPEGVLTAADDTDPDESGLQFTLAGESSGLREEVTVNLFLDDEMTEHSAQLAGDGSFEIPDVTLPRGTHTLFVRTATGSVTSDEEQQYTLKVLEISSPQDDARIDTDPGSDVAEIEVTVEVFGITTSEEVRLSVNGNELGEAENPDASGRAVFAGVTLEEGENEIKAFVEEDDLRVESTPVNVEVVERCPVVTFLTPALGDGEEEVTLGGEDGCPDAAAGEAFSTLVEITTDAGDGRTVELFVNGQPTQSTRVSGTVARFDDVNLPNRTRSNTLTVEVENEEGVACLAETQLEVRVDCAGPDCQIVGPTPVDYIDDEDQLTLYLNASMQSGGGYDIEVESSEEVEGRSLNLIVDGRTGSALSATAEEADDGTRALFDSVPLAEGAHTIEARCEDEAGNVTVSGEVSWVVDTMACEVAVSDPAASTLFVPGDDNDSSATGTQVVVTSSVLGADCVEQRAAVCDPESGISGVGFVSYAGDSPLMSTVTLDEGEVDQSLCVEIVDRAGNVGRGSVDVAFRASGPSLQIERPSTGDRYNALGNDGYMADAVPLSDAVCDAEFWIACSEAGRTVSLRHGDISGPVFASGTCVEPAEGDPDLPNGFAGRAKISAAFENGDDSAVIVATQRLLGSSGSAVTGVSEMIRLEGDCQLPRLSYEPSENPCSPGTGGQISLANSVTDFTAFERTGDAGVSLSLAVEHDIAGSLGPFAPEGTTGSAYDFLDVDRGPAGTATVRLSAEDAFANRRTLMCGVTIIADLPVIAQLSSPTNGQQFGPGGGCDTGVASEYGVPVVATIDQDADRTANVLLDGAELASDVPITGGMIDVCVPVPDDLADGQAGSTRLTLQLLSEPGPGSASAVADVNVRTAVIDDPAPSQSLTAADNCAGSGFGYAVSATIDAVHQGATYTIASANGQLMGVVDTQGAESATVGGCLQLATAIEEEGLNTIFLTIDGTMIARTVDVTVNSTPPSTTLSIDEVELPADGPGYRDGLVTLRWNVPTGDYQGQLADYALRCARSEIATEQQWESAEALGLPANLTPQSPASSGMHEASLEVPVGQSMQCVLRATDAAGQLTPIGPSADLTKPFREQIIATPSGVTQAGMAVAAIGDVSGDQIDDLLVGNRGSAVLIFGSASASSFNVTKTFTGGVIVGDTMAGLGDINGDGLNDFALGDRLANSFAGRTNVFFGRTAAEWETLPDTVSIDGACSADLCFEHTEADSFFGWGLQSAGDFDADGTPDIAVGAAGYPNGDFLGQAFVILGAPYEEPERACNSVDDCRGTEACRANAMGESRCMPPMGQFWRLAYQVPSGEWINPPGGGDPVPTLRGFYITVPDPAPDPPTVEVFGRTFATLGAFDALPGDDLVISAPGLTSSGTAGQLFYLSGRSAPSSPGLTALGMDALGGPGSVPAGEPFASGPTQFAAQIASGDMFDDDDGLPDLLVHAEFANHVLLYRGAAPSGPGQPQRALDLTVRINGTNEIGASMALPFFPALPPHPAFETPELLGDLDGDGLADLLLGSRTGSPGPVYLLYAAEVGATAEPPGTQQNWELETTAAEAGTNIAPPTEAGTSRRVVAYVGDADDDGHPDILVGDPGPSGGPGRITLLY